MSLVAAQDTFAQNVAKLLIFIHEKKYRVTLGEAFRTLEQAQIYAKEGKGITDSLHCKRLAIDLNLFNPSGVYLTDSKEYQLFGIYWEQLDPLNRWGGHFKRADGNHFEMNA